MKTNKYFFYTMLLMGMALAFSLTAAAQRYNRGRGYNGYNRNYYQPRARVSINIGRPYSYRPYYSRPVYSYHRPVYRAPYPYAHFGPSFGFHINVLPFGYSSFYYSGSPYYYNDGVYYRPYNGGGYEVAAPPIGASVKHLPSGTKVTVIDGVKYYELGGTFYQEEINEKNKVMYRVVGTDGVLNTGSDDQGEEDSNAIVPADKQPAVVTNNAAVPEVGTRFDKLPEGSKAVVLKKEKYYVSPSGVYFQEVIDGNNIRYEVTGNSDIEK